MRISRRILLVTLCTGLLGLLAATLLFPGITPTARADHKSGHSPGGGGGSDDGGTSEPPPLTYEIRWIENFHLTWDSVNHDGDLLGRFDSDSDPFPYAIVYGGDVYPVELFFLDLEASSRFTFGLSDRAGDGSIYLCGTCDTADGIRGWLMRLTPDLDGALARTEFSIVQPLEGDDVTSLRDVNSSGEAVGYSRLTSTGSQAVTAIYHTTAGGSLPFEFSVSTSVHFITNSGYWVGPVYNADGSFTVKGGTPGGNLEALADDVFLEDVNNLGHFVGRKTVCETTRKGANTITTCTSRNYFFDGTLTLLNEGGPAVLALNDYDDLLSVERIEERRNDPGYDSGLLYFADLDREVPIDDMIDLNNTDADLALWFGTDFKTFTDVTNSGVIVGNITSPDFTGTFILIPVQP